MAVAVAITYLGITERPGVVLADAGYWKNEAIEVLVAQGIQTLVAPATPEPAGY